MQPKERKRSAASPIVNHRPSCSRVLLNHLIGAADERGRELESENLGSLQIDDELELRDQLDRQIRGLFAIEDSSGINASATMGLREISSVAHQASCVREVPRLSDCGQAVPHRQRGKLPTAKRKVRVRSEDEAACRFLGSGGEDLFKLL